MDNKPPLKIICHSKNAIRIGIRLGWLPGANYNHIRDIREFRIIGLIDIDWKNYDFDKHFYYVKKYKPILTVAKDILKECELDSVVKQAERLGRYANKVIVVPKDLKLSDKIDKVIPKEFIIGFSVPSTYAKTEIPIEKFYKRKIHLLGGRPDLQRMLGKMLDVYSFDCNRITIDAKFGYYFDGARFVKNGVAGYLNCIRKSMLNINRIWKVKKGSE